MKGKLLVTNLSVGNGRRCTLMEPDVPLLSDYYVLSVSEHEGQLSSAEVDELFLLAQHLGRELARARHGHEQCYSIIYNAARTRRKPWPHFHILLAGSTLEKRKKFTLLQLKHVLRFLARPGLAVWRRVP
jgi:hypothetical protein